MKNRNKGQKGFTLIELGIVIAVIAVLATVVIVGVGFISTSKVSKGIDAITTVRKGAAVISGLGGGQFPVTSTGNEIGGLRTRGFVPGTGTGAWTVMQGLTVVDIRWSSGLGAANAVAVSLTCQAGQCQDIWNSFNQDPNRLNAGSPGGLTCATAVPAATATSLIICFMI